MKNYPLAEHELHHNPHDGHVHHHRDLAAVQRNDLRPQPVSSTARALAAFALLFTLGSIPTMALAACGDGILEGNEQCDPGPYMAGGCCNTDCNFTGGETSCTDDGNTCTNDYCDGAGTCTHPSNFGLCDDGLFCTSGDSCTDGQCTGSPTCPEARGCSDTCNEAEEACRTCGHPFSEQRCVVNAIFVLQAAVDLRDCEVCTCDVDASGMITTSDALRILRTCVNLPVALICPDPLPSTTTSTVPSTSIPASASTALTP